MSLRDFEELLRRTTGLDAASVGSASVEHAVREREVACGLDRPRYLDRVRSSAAELQALVEAIVVPETWFFRDPEAFAALAAMAREQHLQAAGERALRLLSLPCASGEEPYSMAMALLDAGLPGDRFRIDAVDISLPALRQAEAGVYGRNSFRGGELGFRERYFAPAADGHRIADAVRRPVQFRHGNVFDPACFPADARYDVVFCRNLLIYFDRPMQDEAICAIARLLGEGGWLFAGSSEGGLWLSAGLVPVKVARSSAFRKTSAVREQREPAPAHARAQCPAPQRRARPRAAARPSEPAPPSQPTNADTDLDAAQRCADQGRLAEAIALCERHLQAHGPDAKALYVLALAHDAQGYAEQAQEYYRKALYLEPAHCEALIHLSYLIEKQGDGRRAQLLRERARRAQSHEREET